MSSAQFTRAWRGGDGIRARIARDYLFVGLTERWRDSVCLLHQRFGAGPVRNVELLNSRPTSTSRERPPELPPALLSDQYDALAHGLAVLRFEADWRACAERNRWVKSCGCAFEAP